MTISLARSFSVAIVVVVPVLVVPEVKKAISGGKDY